MSANIPYKLLKSECRSYTGSFNSEDVLTGVSIDSRTVKKGELFVPIIGERFDGHEFAETAVTSGAKALFWQEGRPLPETVEKINVPIFYVQDTLVAMQQLSKRYLNEVNPSVVAVTGSIGKTTTKDMVAHVLEGSLHVHKTKGNYNNHIGMPLTLLQMPKDTEVLVVELGMNHAGEISFLSQHVCPDLSVITNIGESHMEQLGSREGIAKAKLEILDGMTHEGTLIVDGDEPLLDKDYFVQKLTCSVRSAQADLFSKNIASTHDGVSFQVSNDDECYHLAMIGEHHVKNALYTIAVANHFHIDRQTVRQRLKNMAKTAMRMERLKCPNTSALLINDAYNASPTSMKAAIESIIQLEGYKRKIVVLGDMYELGDEEKSLHKSVAEVIRTPITDVVTVGEKALWIAQALTEQFDDKLKVKHFSSKEIAEPFIRENLDEQTVVLFKASRGLKFEEIIEELCSR
ncbi:UDP-N-acetylmuramoyl-tripeptide--D-alanyl-D-alanine ligase [Texcoconibacillus texcoconensis]|uniref:UDP-N-acetylmuramoyl-tripeptide--D-alanyl-D-alanine ligase n=1 Tax=Texcoconibacillus texcoconensis TaxID=1095777 RepID=A0A840QLE6_9BACI|nr:UDP-N-acetylmuramoyl-tripeptide--D-alanyl-D-alanine ligase [Texcoconibacillus texcoconensis]MBB5172176.1 UDP-N-acetylmuramoyl-tripeptide--D-alanyl-D-alanine ligase [Texcoconibacillus texcoconensis]